MIIELAGMPGAGKTARAHELALQCKMPIIQAPTQVVLLLAEGLAGALQQYDCLICASHAYPQGRQ